LITVTLPIQYQGVRVVRAVVAGTHTLLQVKPGRKVTASFVGKPGGAAALVIGRRGKPTFKRVYVLCARGSLSDYNLPVLRP
jgi:hypothetical protein